MRRPMVMKQAPAQVAAALLAVALLSGCGADSGDSVADPAGSGGGASSSASAPGDMPTSVPPPKSEVVGVGTVLDLGQGDGPQLCLGAVAESLPPQCSGVPITNWDWKPLIDTSEASGSTRWGSYAVTGTYDGETFTITEKPVSPELYDPAAPTDNPFVTPCPEPERGWQVVDKGKVDYQDQDAVYAAATQLPTYAGAFLDQQGADFGEPGTGPGATIVNVLVTEDPEGAEEALRQVWGGPLCVTVVEHTEAELLDIQESLQGLPGLQSSSPQLDKLVVNVIWDDGTLQEWADAAYGEGLVAVRPILRLAAK